MPGLLLHADADSRCSHGGKVMFAPTQVRALAADTPILTTTADKITVPACPGVSGVVLHRGAVGKRLRPGEGERPAGAGPGPAAAARWRARSRATAPSPRPAAEVPLVAAMQLRVVAT